MSNRTYGIGLKRTITKYLKTKQAHLLNTINITATSKLICGDSNSKLKDIPSNSIDLVVTDPPYKYRRFNKHGKIASNSKTFSSNNKLLNKITNGFNIPVILSQLVRVLKHINMYIWCSNQQVYQLLNFMESHYHCHYIILTWYKNKIKRGSYQENEFCIYFYDDHVIHNRNTMSKDGCYIYPENQFEEAVYHHPTIKPIFILRNLIINSSKQDDTVLDPFVGSGSTGVASVMIDRNFIGIDKEPVCIKESRYRINQSLAYDEGLIQYEINFTKGFTKNDASRADKKIIGKVMGDVKTDLQAKRDRAIKQAKELDNQLKQLKDVKVMPKETRKQKHQRNILIGKMHFTNPNKWSVSKLHKKFWWITKASITRACYHYKKKYLKQPVAQTALPLNKHSNVTGKKRDVTSKGTNHSSNRRIPLSIRAKKLSQFIIQRGKQKHSNEITCPIRTLRKSLRMGMTSVFNTINYLKQHPSQVKIIKHGRSYLYIIK